jgi:hypothetical protein
MTARELLLAAADYIEQYGWAQNTLGEAKEPACARGAMCGAAEQAGTIAEPIDHPGANRLLVAYLELDSDGMQTSDREAIYAWNDADERTAAEVIAALRGAAGVQS